MTYHPGVGTPGHIFRSRLERHNEFEAEVAKHLEALGFIVPKAVTYHDALPADIRDMLKVRPSLTARYLRTRADRIAIHPKLPLELEYECKVGGSARRDDVVVRALPLALYRELATWGVRMLYCHRHPHTGREVGWWCHQPPPVRVVMFPPDPRRDDRVDAFLRHRLGTALESDVRSCGPTAGGGVDPFAVIDAATPLPDWRQLVDDLVADNTQQEG